MSYMIFSSIRNRHETVLLGPAGSHTTETARSLANKASEAPDRSVRTQFPPQPMPVLRVIAKDVAEKDYEPTCGEY